MTLVKWSRAFQSSTNYLVTSCYSENNWIFWLPTAFNDFQIILDYFKKLFLKLKILIQESKTLEMTLKQLRFHFSTLYACTVPDVTRAEGRFILNKNAEDIAYKSDSTFGYFPR